MPDGMIEEVRAELYTIPTDGPEADGTLSWSSTTVVVVWVRTGNQEGIGWTYSAPAAKAVVDDTLAGVVTGMDAFGVPEANEAMVRACRNQGVPGVVSCAISAVDIAMWDLKAHLVALPLSELLGRARHGAPVYGSGGFTTYDDPTLQRQLQGWLSMGIERVKIKIGESWGHDVARDLSRVAQTRDAVGPEVEVFVDANGAYGSKQAVRVGEQLVGEWQVSWFEEPVSSDDLAGLRQVRARCAADIAAGEYGYTPSYFARLVRAGAVDCLQADVTRCGGYTGWLGAAGLARAAGMEISAHCAPNLHLHGAVTIPNLRHLEYFHDHVRIETMVFDGALVPDGGELVPTDAPGHGMTLRRADAEQYRRQ